MEIDIKKASIEVLLAQYGLALAVLKDDNLPANQRAEAHGIIGNPAFTDSIEKKLKDMKANDDPDYINSLGAYYRLEGESINHCREQEQEQERKQIGQYKDIMYH